MRGQIHLHLIALLLFLPSLCGAQTIVITGSPTMHPLMTDIVRRFQELNPAVTIDLRPGTSGKGIADLRAGTSDIAMISRQLAGNERELFSFPLCRDGAAIVVHRSNTLKGLSRRQLSDVLTGKVTDWRQLGGRPGPITVAWRPESQSIPDIILAHLKLKDAQVRSHSVISESADAVAFVARNRNAITVSALAVAERSMKAKAAIKVLAYEGIPASNRSVRDRTYPLSRPLNLVTRSIPEGPPKLFVDYAVSRAVNDLHEKHGFVPYED